MTVKVYQYPRCGTCKKALKWLDAHGVDYESIDITEKPPSKTALKKHWKASGLPIRKLFNTSGKSYREGGFKEKLATMSDAEAIEALAADGKLIKRPLVVGDDFVLVGFKEPEYEAHLG
jgi:arsenate reductase